MTVIDAGYHVCLCLCVTHKLTLADCVIQNNSHWLFYKVFLIFRYEMLDAARNKIRVKVAYLMMGVTILACLVMVYWGKQVRMILLHYGY